MGTQGELPFPAFHPLGRACKLRPHGPPPCFSEPLLTARSIGKSVLKEGGVPEQKLRQVVPCGPSGVSVCEVWSSIPPGTVSSPKVAFPPMLLHVLVSSVRANSENGRRLPYKEPRRKTEPMEHLDSFLLCFFFEIKSFMNVDFSHFPSSTLSHRE